MTIGIDATHRITLTPRDEHLLIALSRFRAARSADLHRFLFAGARRDTMLHRLQRLTAAGYLDSLRPSPSEQQVVRLGSKGRAWLRCRGVDPRRSPRHTHLDHHLAVVSLWCELAATCHAAPRLHLLSCLPDWELRARGPALVFPDLLARVATVDPAEGPMGHTLVVEVDRGLEPHRILARKLETYRTQVLDPGGPFGDSPTLVFALIGAGAARVRSITRLLAASWHHPSFILQDLRYVGQVLAALPRTPHTSSPDSVGGPAAASAVLPISSQETPSALLDR